MCTVFEMSSRLGILWNEQMKKKSRVYIDMPTIHSHRNKWKQKEKKKKRIPKIASKSSDLSCINRIISYIRIWCGLLFINYDYIYMCKTFNKKQLVNIKTMAIISLSLIILFVLILVWSRNVYSGKSISKKRENRKYSKWVECDIKNKIEREIEREKNDERRRNGENVGGR